MTVSLDFKGALDYADERSGSNSTTGSTAGSCSSSHTSENSNQGALIFLHAGTYRGEFLVIDSDIALIGNAVGKLENGLF